MYENKPDLIDSLSAEAQEYLLKLFRHPDQELVVTAFQSRYFRQKVSAATGLRPEQVDLLSREVKECFYKYRQN